MKLLIHDLESEFDRIVITRDGDGYKVSYNERVEYYNRLGQLHRDNDEPAVIKPDGYCSYYKNGLLHRDNKPAIIYPDGATAWFDHGEHIK